MLKYFSSFVSLSNDDSEPAPTEPQVRQSRLGVPYEAPKKPANIMPTKTVAKPVHLPESNPTEHRVSRLGKKFEETPREPPPPSTYEIIDDDSENPIVSFMLSCVTCDDEMSANRPVLAATKEME